MTGPLISCIVPVFNGERYLQEATDSILHQTYRPLEIIIVDDGSTDGTAAVAASYGEQIIYLWQANAGPAAARNLGLSAAHAEFVAFLDADDLWQPEKLAQQVARFAARPDLDLSLTYVQNFWTPELHEKMPRFADHPLAKPFPGYAAPALLARRTLFNASGWFNPNLHHGDIKDWFLRAAEQGAVMEVLPDILVHRRLHETNLSHHKAAVSREEHLQLVKASLDRRRRAGGATPTAYQLPFAKDDESK
ncbi:MAG: glycosyltransferase family 2 protein [Deltaproteobacteria bacterium]|nr:glycosyltransferase family 2 protein [Deltaproteobacteria bacterium]